MGKVMKPTGWKDGELRSVNRPKVLESKNNKVDLLKQSAIISGAKKGKADINALPAGVIHSIETKAKIDDAISHHDVDIDSIRQRLNITAKPLNLKNAKIQRDEIQARFDMNRNKANSKGATLENLKKELKRRDQHDIEPEKIAASRAPIKKAKTTTKATKATKATTTKTTTTKKATTTKKTTKK
jgi:predicted  nucleic acid-binding Zn-ribbon protein